ncbi:hypothetical protein DPMN_090849 [Dreissena polymorpha]|uniref:Uncharacterized protein n=1 Tax=Dreissena polymorpha TaxID=45954 RepID=A0A9D4KYH4_DREPO|nr:hypothetical protein DPMN_090849 [Dreissena polymorpha]
MDFRVFPEVKSQLRGIRVGSKQELTVAAKRIVSSFTLTELSFHVVTYNILCLPAELSFHVVTYIISFSPQSCRSMISHVISLSPRRVVIP